MLIILTLPLLFAGQQHITMVVGAKSNMICMTAPVLTYNKASVQKESSELSAFDEPGSGWLMRRNLTVKMKTIYLLIFLRVQGFSIYCVFAFHFNVLGQLGKSLPLYLYQKHLSF